MMTNWKHTHTHECFTLTKIRLVSVKRLSGRKKSDCWTDNARTVRLDV